MKEGETGGFEDIDLNEYKTLETRLYGELIKSCRSYSNNLDIISILGILELVKQEIKDLEKTNLRYKKNLSPQEFVTDRLE